MTGSLPLSQAFNLLMAWPGADFMGVISALGSANLAQLLAKPTLLVRSGESASFLAGGQIPVPVPQAGSVSNAITIDYHKFGVQLKLKATVLDDRRIVINVTAYCRCAANWAGNTGQARAVALENSPRASGVGTGGIEYID